MPIVNGQKISFDPYELARLIHFGHDVQPDVNDSEDWDTQQQRISTESEMIMKNMYYHFPETYWKLMGVEPQNNLRESGPANQLWQMKEIG